MRAFCPSCHQEQSVEVAHAVCGKCGSPIVLDGKYVLTSSPGSANAADEVDGAFPIRTGEDIRSHEKVAIRIASLDGAARLDREATVLKGLQLAGVPRVLSTVDVPGVGRALVMAHPAGRTLEQAIGDGLRTNADGARAFLDGILHLLAELHALSPPVIHRNVHPGSIFWEPPTRVALWDFARATDTVDDATADRVLARPGYFPSTDRIRDPVQGELYSVGAVVIHMLARKSPEQMPLKHGVPDFRPLVRVDEDLAQFIDRLMGARRPFHSAQEALEALRLIQVRTSSSWSLGFVAALAALLMVGGAGAVMFMRVPKAAQPVPVTTSIPPPVPDVPPPPRPPAPPPVPAASSDVELRVTTEPEGAEVLIDGLAAGRTPLTTTILPGKVITIEARRPGYLSRQEQVTMDIPHALRWVLKKEEAKNAEPDLQPIVVKSDDRIQRELKRLVEQQAEELTRCNVDRVDRVRFRVGLAQRGTVDDVDTSGRETRVTSCVGSILKGLSSPKLAGGGYLNADVWIYFSPAFKVAVF